ncbi:hypothetical protein [Mailhella massiliensis]|uniref:Uncharacterized protein n=1 Tax=Mailhella massiliensis TaxID=1903261 RepID=A0A921DTK0_9BACT|nr:hypothetical protein [Mailhella massiliensis]HJD98162.1 hypothetical protein [Mailhella massiliensis]
MRNRVLPVFLCLLALSALALSGCAEMNKAYKETKTFYHTHINRPSTLNTEERTVLEDPQRALVQSVMPIDEELTRLEKALDALATPPDAEAAAGLLRRFPWLSGLAMVAPDGTLGASIPSVPLKQLDYAPLLELAPKALPRDLRASVQDTPLGPEILLARPFLQEDQLQLLLVATFDFRALLPFASSPGNIIVRSADVIIWSGDMDYSATPMASVDWGEYLKEHSDGILTNDNGSMLWISRYLGGKPLVFASPLK